jgi:curved DNA-binding protein
LKGRGIPGRLPGDLYVVLSIALPPAETEAAKAAYRELERAQPFNPRARMGG